MNKFCRICGERLPEGLLYCPECLREAAAEDIEAQFSFARRRPRDTIELYLRECDDSEVTEIYDVLRENTDFEYPAAQLLINEYRHEYERAYAGKELRYDR